MFKKVFSFIFILLLTGCGVRDAKIMVRDEKLRYGCCVVGNKNYVSIGNVWNEMDALPLAEEHCSKYGRTAKFNSMVVLLKEKIPMVENYRARFDCVN